ncbi:hypothetical protein ABT272_28165 [Streptomyces sp900105245]|uniref:Uncharacterized protein n=1 Tax=Streptomyces sp. 900105245 TaxID=3154379 RepID=A0ABV1UCY9_9ACTN
MTTPPAPPAVGKGASVKVDQQLYDDLATMMRTGMKLSDALRSAVAIVAGTYRAAWDTGRCPDGVRPTITRYFIDRYDTGQEPERGTVQTSVPTPYRERPTERPTPPGPGPTAGTTRQPTRRT